MSFLVWLWLAGVVAASAQVPSITSIDPTYQIAGSPSFVLTVTGTNFLVTSTVQWNGSSRSTTFVSATQLRANILVGDIAIPGTANITVVNPDPGGGVSNPIAFPIGQVPSLTGLSPDYQIEGQPTFVLSVNGNNFVSGSTVTWNGATRTTTFVSSTQLRADISAGDIATSGSVNVAVVNPAPGGGTSNQVVFTIYSSTPNPAPQISAISPSFNLVGGAPFTLTVTGTGFVTGSVIRWNLSSRSTTYVSNTELRADVLASDIAAAIPVSVSVLNPVPGGGISNSMDFTINTVSPLPGATSLSPSAVTRLGPTFVLTVNGSNFVSGSVVYWNGSARATTFVNNSILRATILDTDILSAGTATVSVLNPAPGGGVSNGVVMQINDASLPPTASTLSPTSVTAGTNGLQLSVTGANFEPSSVIRWNGVDRTTTFVGGTEVRASIPASDVTAAGTASVTVYTPPPGGGTSGILTFTIDNPLPSITGLTPSSVLAGSLAVVLTVNGVNFVNGSKVQWNAADLVTTYVSSSQLKATIPSANLATASVANITVVNVPTGGGTSAAEPFTINNVIPTITSVAPSVVTAGDADFTLTVNGTGFLAGTRVRWNGVLRGITYVNANQITVAVTASDIALPGTAVLAVNNPTPGGGDSPVQNLTINYPVPVAASLSPDSAGVGTPGLTVTVNGSKFFTTSKVRWNGSDRAVTFVSNTQLKVALTTTDLAKAGANTVTVFNGTPGGGTSEPLTFMVNYGQPTISSIAPDSAAAAVTGITLTVNGSNFVNNSVIRWNGTDLTTKFVSASKLTAALAATDLSQPGTVNVIVNNPPPGGGLSNTVTFTITPTNPVPTITSLDPAAAQVGVTAFSLTVNGTGFVSGSKVRWNGTDRDTQFVSSTVLTASILDADVAKIGTASITVFNPTPGGGSSVPRILTIGNPAPEITSLSPTAGLVGSANLTLTVNGKNFLSTSKVRWNGTDITTKFVNSLQLNATVPAANMTQEGKASITVFTPSPGGGSSASQDFTIAYSNPVPSIVSLNPTSIRAGSSAFVLTANGSNFVKTSKVQINGVDRATTYVTNTRLTAQILETDIAQTGTVNITVFNPEPGGGSSTPKPLTIGNPLPTVTNLSPGSAVVGSTDLAVTVYGKNFVSTAKVRWNGADRSTKFVDSTHLTVTIPAADLAKVATNVITVLNVATDGPSNPVSFVVNNLLLSSLVLTPTSVKGGGAVTGTAILNGAAKNGGAVVSLSSNNNAIAIVPTVVAIPGGSDRATFQVTVKNVTETCSVAISASFGGVTQRRSLVVADSSLSDSLPDTTQFVPIVLSTAGVNNSFYTSALTLTNRGTHPAIMDFSYLAAIGEGSGAASDFLLPGEQRVASNAITYLRALGIPIPDAGNRGGTLQIHFWGIDSTADVSANVRTTTQVSNGRAGLSYPAVPPSEALSQPAYLFGLRQNATDRSNLAIQNAGGSGDGDIVLSITIYSGNPGDTYATVLPDEVLSPGAFKQFNAILGMDQLGLTNGYVRIERTSGSAPYYAYAVINDQATSDGSFVPPIPEGDLFAPRGLTLPVIVETPVFNSELILTNSSGTTRNLRCTYVADAITSSDHSLSFAVELKPGQQIIYPNLVQRLRNLGASSLPLGNAYMGALFVTDDRRDVSGIFVGCRTSAPGGGGRYGLFYTGVPYGKAARQVAWVYGLQQNLENRSNLALINTGEVDSSVSAFAIDIFSGPTGALVKTISGVNVQARHFLQLSMILDLYATGITQGYVRVRKVSGNNPFITYGVINDGGEPGARTGDGTFVQMYIER